MLETPGKRHRTHFQVSFEMGSWATCAILGPVSEIALIRKLTCSEDVAGNLRSPTESTAPEISSGSPNKEPLEQVTKPYTRS